MRRVLVMLFLSLSVFVHGQFNRSQLLGEYEEIIVPFNYVNGFILVDVIFQKILPMKFILDTGAENSILLKKEYTELLRTPYHKKIKLYGSDLSDEVTAYVCNGIYLQFLNTRSVRHNILVLENDFVHLDEYIGSRVDGILGAEFFKGLIMKIDYKKFELVLIDPSKFNKSRVKNHQAFDIEIISSKPYLQCITEVKPGLKVKTRLLIDTGAALTALFHHNTDSLLSTSGLILKGSLGKGLGGDIEGFSGRIHKLQMGDFSFNNLLSSFQEIDSSMLGPQKVIRNGILGNLLLERFDVFLDFSASKLYMKSKKNYNKDFEYDKSGMTVFAYGNTLNKYYIRYVIEKSPASEADIRPGDIILKIGIFSYKWYSLRQINGVFSSRNGRKIKLKLKRGDEILIKEVVLRDLFSDKHISL
ncbi:MAG: aspartyl protease family protein [Saprospiraceae bacterium]|nr:aspartyl protease family protein [Saprospiraceae bacterium]